MFEVNSEDPFIQKVYDHSRANEMGYCWRKVFVVDDFYKNPDEIRAVSYTHLTLPTNREV